MAPFVDSSALLVELWFNGLYCSFALWTLYLVVASAKNARARKYYQAVLIIGPYVCSTLHMVAGWVLVKDVINDNESSTGPGVLASLMHRHTWATGLALTSFALNICFADFVVIWRCWTVWGRNWTVIVLPILCSISGAVIAGITIADQILATRAHESQFASEKTAQFVTFSTVFFSLSIATSLTTALLIAARIVSVQRASSISGSSSRKTYSSIIEIVVESAAIYSLTLLVFIIILTRHHTPTSQFYSENFHAQIAGIAPLMILYRITANHARPDSEWEQTTVLSALQFASRPQPSPQVFRSEDGSLGYTAYIEGSNSNMVPSEEHKIDTAYSV